MENNNKRNNNDTFYDTRLKELNCIDENININYNSKTKTKTLLSLIENFELSSNKDMEIQEKIAHIASNNKESSNSEVSIKTHDEILLLDLFDSFFKKGHRMQRNGWMIIMKKYNEKAYEKINNIESLKHTCRKLNKERESQEDFNEISKNLILKNKGINFENLKNKSK